MKHTIYVAGPMRGKENNNETAFHNAEKRLNRRGFTVINPLNIGRSIASDEVIAGDADLLKTVMKIERMLIRHCDAIYLLEGWKESEGAKAELVTAIGFDCMIFLESEDIEARQEKEYKNGKKPWNPDGAETPGAEVDY
jgi:hypothetical protein